MTQRSFLLKSFFPTLGSVLMIVSGCGKTVSPEQSANAPTIVPTSKLAAPQFQNLMDLANLGESKRFQDSGFGALGSEALLKQQQESKILPIEQFDLTALPASAKFVRPRGAALIGGSGKVSTSAGVVVLFPAARLGESFLFGGVITGVSDLESDQLGGLKLSGINTVSVRPLISSYQGQVYLSLVGCLEKCGEGAKQLPVADIPVLGVSADQNEVVLDLSALSSTLKIQDLQNFDKTVFEPTQQAATLNTQTSLVDFSLGSLVFDVVSQMKLVNAASEGTPSTESLFDLTTRFFLRPESSLDSSFAARPNVPGLKYFETSRVAQPAITRFSLSSSNGMAPIHYYVKNVPKKWKSSFDKAFAAWAASFKMLTGREILTWEHVVEGSDLDRNIITGDVRFNVLEWDLKNQASYGGLGPSISNETTGQLMAAHTLIQGPAVLKLYSAWYKTWQKARELQSKGNAAEAEALVAKFDRASQRKALKKTSGRLSLNSEIGFQLHSANDKLSDPLVGGEFFSFPETETYESYMDGYFQDMVTHELGHNFGLRHNFRGSLGRAGEMPEGRVSVSSMEYLDRNFRNFSRIGEHDFMAISYGYTGLAPYRTDLFCTDNDAAGLASNPNTGVFPSPECNNSDGGVDAFGYHIASLSKAYNMILAPELKTASPWKFAQLGGRVGTYLTGSLAYYKSAPDNFSTWTNWTGKAGLPERPTQSKKAQVYVVEQVAGAVCNAGLLQEAFLRKNSPGAKSATAVEAKALLSFVLDFAEKNAGIKQELLAPCVDALATATKATL